MSSFEPGAPEPIAASVGLVGAGLLGTAIAERLMTAENSLVVHDASEERRVALRELGAAVADDVADVVTRCARVLLCLPDSAVVDRVLAEALPVLRSGQVVVDTTTGDPEVVRGWSGRLAERGVALVDATVLGSSEQLRRGEALVMVGGSEEDVTRCRDLLDVLAARSVHVGECGSGQTMKLVANLVLGLNRAALAEGLAFARSQGLDPDAVVEVLRGGVAHSRVMDTKAEKMIRGDFTPQARLSQHRKDVDLILEAARRADVELPLSTTHHGLLASLERDGHGQLDNSAVVKAWDDDLAG